MKPRLSFEECKYRGGWSKCATVQTVPDGHNVLPYKRSLVVTMCYRKNGCWWSQCVTVQTVPDGRNVLQYILSLLVTMCYYTNGF